jgi:hypothetical protein
MCIVVRWAVIFEAEKHTCAGQRPLRKCPREGKMNNDFIGNELHKARRHDLMKEAEGSRKLRAAGVNKPDRPIGMLMLKAIGAAITVFLIAEVLAR